MTNRDKRHALEARYEALTEAQRNSPQGKLIRSLLDTMRVMAAAQ